MARQTKIKLAALATSFIAALSIVAVSPATASHAAGTTRASFDRNWCC